MRGKRIAPKSRKARCRITPADAGKTPTERRVLFCSRDHPRGCGENAFSRWCSARTCGSPPRMRGKPAPEPPEMPQDRITPADAGKTLRRSCAGRREEDHPRGCGENSSPCIFTLLSYWITPADAGKTQYRSLSRISAEDHPRGCGENCSAGTGQVSPSGSPPRMRGKHGGRVQEFRAARITPADAGKTGTDKCGVHR